MGDKTKSSAETQLQESLGIQIHETPWQKGVLMICQKCGTAISTDKTEEPLKLAEKLRDTLRAEVRKSSAELQLLGPQVRVMLSGCLSICEKEQQALAYFDNGNTNAQVFTLDPSKPEAQTAVIEFLKAKLKN